MSTTEILSRLEVRLHGTDGGGGLNALQILRLQNGDVLRLVVASPATAATEESPAREAQYKTAHISGVSLSGDASRDGWDELCFELTRQSGLRARVRLSLGQLTAVPLESRGFKASDAVDQRTGALNAIWNAQTFQTRSATQILEALVAGVRVARVYPGKVDGVTRYTYRFERL